MIVKVYLSGEWTLGLAFIASMGAVFEAKLEYGQAVAYWDDGKTVVQLMDAVGRPRICSLWFPGLSKAYE